MTMDSNIVYAEMGTRLRDWCQGESLDETRAVLALVPTGVEVAQIEETLQTVKVLGRVRVRVAQSPPTEGEQPQAVKTLLDAAGPTSSVESIIRAVGDVLAKVERPGKEYSGYHRLRMFSGSLPTPPGEETLEQWLEQARWMVDESDCSDKEKRRRIIECLRGPALAVVKAVRTAEPDLTPSKCLDAIESAFGTAESGEDLYFKFRLLQQEKDERLSDFLRRVEQSLTLIARKGGMPASRVDAARVEQLLRGAVYSDLMLVQLKLRERRQNPPKFLELLTEVRAEEEYAAARIKLRASVQR
ncbi:paraneoplastic antigen Ma1 homolog, partial [Nematolebias whitei]|uniref:paraneoplastic antigen Ma1 homolog n=1 Tax=Nematolebias whitei TaxID=451745 RepID=UPI00189AD4DD